MAKFNITTNVITKTACTFIGTTQYDQVYGVQTDDSGYVYIMGQTQGAFPVVGAGIYSNPNSSQFAAKISNNLQNYVRSTVFGKGSTTTTDISPNAFLVDVCGNIYISGWGGPVIAANPGSTTGLPVTANAFKSNTDGSDFYFIVFDKDFTGLLFASFFGQQGGSGGEHVDGGTSRFDPQGRIYQSMCANCGGATGNPGIVFPTSPGVWSTTNPSPNCNLAALKIDFQLIGPSALALPAPSTKGCAPFTVNFSNFSSNATSYIWNFGDGSPVTTAVTPSHTYFNTGVFTVSLVAINPVGCAGNDTAKLIITVINDSIVGAFNPIKIDSCNPFTVNVNNSSSFFGSSFGPSTKWLWNFGDGNTSTVQNPPVHAYASPGTYNISVTITDTNACNSPVTVTKVVSYTANVVDANFVIPNIVCPPYTHSFSNTGVGGAITSYFWNFGDGGTATTATASHTYTAPGTYTVTLIVGNPTSCNKFDTSSYVLKVQPKITADFTYTKLDTCNSYLISLNNTSIPNNLNPNSTTYFWNFGDGDTSTLKSPGNHTYSLPGNYTITLTLTDTAACNSPQVFSLPISFIDNNVRAELQMPDSVCRPYTHNFLNNSYNVTTYNWQFGDGKYFLSEFPNTHLQYTRVLILLP